MIVVFLVVLLLSSLIVFMTQQHCLVFMACTHLSHSPCEDVHVVSYVSLVEDDLGGQEELAGAPPPETAA